MKKSYIVFFIAALASFAIIVSASKDVSTYGSFKEAESNLNRVKIAGVIDKTQDIDYEPIEKPNSFGFSMIDNNGDVMPVIVTKPKPQDFEQSETVVVTGKVVDGSFVADEILMKCPSKYKDEELQLKAEAATS